MSFGGRGDRMQKTWPDAPGRRLNGTHNPRVLLRVLKRILPTASIVSRWNVLVLHRIQISSWARGLRRIGHTFRPLDQFLLQFLFRGQVELILRCIDVRFFRKGESDESIVLCPAEDDADRRVLIGKFYLAVVIIHVHLHLAEVLVRDLPDLEVDQDITPEEAVVEHKVHKVMICIEGEPFLPG